MGASFSTSYRESANRRADPIKAARKQGQRKRELEQRCQQHKRECQDFRLAEALQCQEELRLQRADELCERDAQLAMQLQEKETQKAKSRASKDKSVPRWKALSIYQKDAEVTRWLQQIEDIERERRIQDEKRRLRLLCNPSRWEIMVGLEPCQKEALQTVSFRAKSFDHKTKALAKLEARVAKMSTYSKEDLHACLEYVKKEAPIIIHLNQVSLNRLAKDSHYRNLFETGTSGGNINTHVRSTWEENMFGAAYNEAQAYHRPKYGCLNLSGDIKGVAKVRCYGPYFMILKPHVRHRCTFYGSDTGNCKNHKNVALGTTKHISHILQHWDDKELWSLLNVCKNKRVSGSESTLEHFVEVQIHGPVCLATDVLALSIPSSEYTASNRVMEVVKQFQAKTNCNLLWQDDLINDQVSM
jgi:hypothetical protein